MKNTVKYGICFFVCLLLAVSIVMPVEAKASTANVVAPSDPVVVGLSGDMSFTATVIDQANLPGTIVKDQEYLPVGYTGALQFNGKGVEVKGVTFGTENACFNFDLHNFGWTGSVYQWNGSKWVKLETTTSDDGEGITTACAVIHGNGTYALLDALTTPQASSFAGSGSTSTASLCPQMTLVYNSTSGANTYYDFIVTFDPQVTYIDFWASEGGLHLSDGSTGTLWSAGASFNSSLDKSPLTISQSLLIKNASILSGSTIDMTVRYYTSETSSQVCTVDGISIPSNLP